MELRQLSWEQVKPIWDTYLWPGRDSEPVTSMKYLGGYDMGYKKQAPHFIGIESPSGALVAVNSYVRTHGDEFRSRGLWVDHVHRRLGYASTMLSYMLDFIAQQGGRMVWTMPREGALEAYQKAGFIRTTGWDTNDWGRNCYAIASLGSIEDIATEAKLLKERRTHFYNAHLRRHIEFEGNMTTEEARQIMRPLADEEEARWR